MSTTIRKATWAGSFSWVEANEDPRAIAWRRNRGSTLKDDAFIAHLEQEKPASKAPKPGKEVPK